MSISDFLLKEHDCANCIGLGDPTQARDDGVNTIIRLTD